MDDIEQAIWAAAYELQALLQQLHYVCEKPQENQENLPRQNVRQIRTQVAQAAIRLATLIIKMDEPQETDHLRQQVKDLNDQIRAELAGENNGPERRNRPPWLTF